MFGGPGWECRGVGKKGKKLMAMDNRVLIARGRGGGGGRSRGRGDERSLMET